MTQWAQQRTGRTRDGERGAALLVGLIMLALLTLHALAALTASTVQLRIAGNMQVGQEAQAAASQAIGQVLSSREFLSRPQAIAATPLDIDVNGDGRSDYRVTVTPTCTAVTPLRAQDLDPGVPEDFQCLNGTAFGGISLCAASHWNLQSVAVTAPAAAATGAAAEINQGVIVRIDAGEARSIC